MLFFSIPTINKLPDGKWFCKRCTYIENVNNISYTSLVFLFLYFLYKEFNCCIIGQF